MRHPSVKKIYWAALVLYMATLIFLTLAPFRLRFPPQLRHFPWPIGPLRLKLFDVVDNILLFLPLGFLLHTLLPEKPPRRRGVQSVIISSGISLTIETLQIIIQARYPSFTDILTNALGGGLGFFIGNLLEKKNLLFYLAFYRQKIALGLLLPYSALLLYLPGLAWEPFPAWGVDTKLLIGNDPESASPWKGSLLSLAIYDRAKPAHQIGRHYQDGPSPSVENNIQKDPLVLYYFLEHRRGLTLDRSLLKPPLDLLFISSSKEEDQSRSGLTFEGSTFLVSSERGNKITERIRATQQFTLEIWIYAERPFDGGGRLVSFVEGNRSLFYLQQNIDDIVFGIRASPFKRGGLHWEGIEQALPAIEKKPVYLAGVYDSGKMTLYVNGEPVAEDRMTDGFFTLADFLNLDWMPFGGRALLGLFLFWPFGFLLAWVSKEDSIPKTVFSTLLGSLFVGLILFVQAQHPPPFFTQRTGGVPIVALLSGMILGEGIKRELLLLCENNLDGKSDLS